jgi:hypothetical protein
MTWVRLDDAFPDHPKVIGLTDAAFRTHVAGLCYAGRYLTDGHIPTSALRQIGTRKAAQELETAALWDRTDHGWVIRDFLDYNPSKADVESERDRRRAAGTKGAQIRWDKHRTNA